MKSKRRIIAVSSIASNGVISLAPQGLAMLTLGSTQFGLFSALYLSSTLVLALTLSLVCDPWGVLNRSKTNPEPQLYASLLVLVVGILLIPAIIVNVIVSRDLLITVLTSGAVGVGTYRVGGRFWAIHWGMFGRAFRSDLVFIACFALGAVLPRSIGVDAFYAAMLAWLLGSIGGLIGIPRPAVRFSGALRWLRGNRKVLGPLVIDTSLAELSMVGTPYVLLPVMGFSTFGIYRGIGNLSAPVRAAFSSVRPLVMRDPLRFCRSKAIGGLIAASFLVGALASGALIVIDSLIPNLGVLSVLRPFAIAAGVCVFGSVLVTTYSAVARALSDTHRLVIGRTYQLVVGFLLPLLGYLSGGAWLSIWGFAAATVSSGFVWLFCSIASRPDQSRQSPQPK